MSEEVLLNSGYIKCPPPAFKKSDRYYHKKLSENPTKFIAVYYYDTFKENGALDYSFEYEYVEERENYWYKTYIWALDKDYPYTIEEIEDILINKENKE